jgi:hypothetical protein
MAERKSKAERRRAAAGEDGGAQPTKAERRQARGGRRQREAPAAQADTSPPPAEIESRLAKIEEAVASQAERSQELLGKLDEVLQEARKSARHAKSAAAQSDEEGESEPSDRAPEADA